jgi:vacuolar-type H+-ATPase subunit F/Vma7
MQEEDYNYYQRCISRFKEMCVAEEKKLFMLGFFNIESITEDRRQELLEFNKEFSQFASNYTLLIILHSTGEEIKHSLSNIDNVCFLELITKTPSNGLLFKTREENDYLEEVINNLFNFDLKKYYDNWNKRSA